MMSHRIVVLVNGTWKLAVFLGEDKERGTANYELNGRTEIAPKYYWAFVSDRMNDKQANDMVISYNIDTFKEKVLEPPRRNRNVIEGELTYVPAEGAGCNCRLCRNMRGEE